MSIADTVARLRDLAADRRPKVAVILGSGWQTFTDRIDDALAIPYAALPAFPDMNVAGHASRLVLGRVGGREVAVLAGRQHAYETGRADGMKAALGALAAFGVTTLVQTNAAASVVDAMRPGALMLIEDHLNMVQASPLVDERGNRRFVDLANAYDAGLRDAARNAAAAIGMPLHEGVYAWVMGPQFETPAEIRMLRQLGAHAVGMSTVPETIIARHLGLRVLALSLITNMGCGLTGEALGHEHTLAVARNEGERATRLLAAVIGALRSVDK